MFRCMVTNKVTRPGEKMNRIVIDTRKKTYTEWVREDGEWVNFEVGYGYEIVKEIQASDEGVNIYNKMVEDGTDFNFIQSLK